MYALVRPALFALPPDLAHAIGMLALGPLEHLGPLRALARAFFAAREPRLRRRVMGLDFATPVGLAAGFDKEARRPRALAALGFGHLELGTVTHEAQAPNPPPNLFRLPRDRALINRLGFPNAGASALARRLAAVRSQIGVPVGVSIGKSRSVALDPIGAPIADYLASFQAVRSVADFVVVNVSSPNTKDLRALQAGEIARRLLGELARANDGPARVPLLVKIAPDLSEADLEDLLEVVRAVALDGVVATNTTISREGLATPPDLVTAMGAGGLSGPPLRARAREVVTRARQRLGSEAVVIGVGGVETSEDAAALLEAGADLVQLYTAFIYGGPGLARRLARGLSDRLAALPA